MQILPLHVYRNNFYQGVETTTQKLYSLIEKVKYYAKKVFHLTISFMGLSLFYLSCRRIRAFLNPSPIPEQPQVGNRAQVGSDDWQINHPRVFPNLSPRRPQVGPRAEVGSDNQLS